MPKFDEFCTPKETIQFTNDSDDLDEDKIKKEMDHKLAFIFVVDRSGSMGCGIRMDMTREALILFMQSLPSGSLFKIVSFGSSYKEMEINGSTLIEYND